MSASPVARQATQSQVIPTRRMLITDPSHMPDVYSSTPGGTIFGTTPGGTKIIYEKSFMMNLRESPISKTPPKCLLPSQLVRGGPSTSPPKYVPKPAYKPKVQLPKHHDDGDTFTMDF